MITASAYVLDIECDRCMDTTATFTGKSKTGCLRKARRDGWKVGKYHTCPSCAYSPPPREMGRVGDKPVSLEQFGIKMVVARVEKNLTPYQLAQQIGCTTPTIVNIEMGRLVPDQETVVRIAEILELELPEGYDAPVV